MSRARRHQPEPKPWSPMRPATPVMTPEKKALMDKVGAHLDEKDHMFINDRFVVLERTNEHGVTWLSIRRLDRAAVRDWRFFQNIKNDICGPEREACELFPAESRLVDMANQYHLWVLPEGGRFPFGFEAGRNVSGVIADGTEKMGARQRRIR